MMKKRILAALLCGVILASTVACDTKDANADQRAASSVEDTTELSTEAPTETPTDTPTETPTEPSTEKPTEPPKDPGSSDANEAFVDYWDLLDTLALLQQENGVEKFRTEHPDLDEREEKILASLCEVDKRALGYCFLDVDEDGNKELLLPDPNLFLRAVYTVYQDKPVFLKAFDTKNSGVFYKTLYNYTQKVEGDLIHNTYTAGKIQNSAYVETCVLGYTYHSDTRQETDHYWVENGEKRSEDASVVNERISLKYPSFPFYNEWAGVTYTSLFEEGAEEIVKERRYRLTSAEGIHKLEVFDRNGNCVYTKESGTEIYCYEQEDILRIHIADSYLFYSLSKDCFSRTLYNVEDNRRELVAYTVEDDNSTSLIVENMFDPSVFHREYECPQNIGSVCFAPDGKSIEISFGSYSKPSKRVFCFETLPILRVTTICYVRMSASVHEDDFYYVSSGNPALLRPANEDTVRLLESLEGGTYKDADGNERKDWYRIVYGGRICFVTADSFEVLTYEVK